MQYLKYEIKFVHVFLIAFDGGAPKMTSGLHRCPIDHGNFWQLTAVACSFSLWRRARQAEGGLREQFLIA